MEQKPSSARIALKWGVICALATIILSTIINVTGMWKSTGASLLSVIPLVIFLVLGMKEYREANGEFMTYGEGLSVGMLIGAISALISSLWGMLYTTVIDSTFLEQVKDFQIEKMEESGLGEEQIDQALQMTEKFSGGGMMFIMGVLGSIFFAFLISLVVAAIMKKNKPVF
ncbi:DUF4199 domain-containing protein [uncultured Arcticibacterium sp.]|uniref:DUF4199 domain-containing protein n=1 Tax=uncultured Arcticibacterium sp. TaxID=2173042 RepID=UPI0030FBB397